MKTRQRRHIKFLLVLFAIAFPFMWTFWFGMFYVGTTTISLAAGIFYTTFSAILWSAGVAYWGVRLMLPEYDSLAYRPRRLWR